MKNKLITVVMFLSIFSGVTLSALTLSGCGDSNDVKVYEAGEDEEISDDVMESGNISYDAETTKEYVYVQLCGAVANPGVYKILSGTRVYEAVEAAGGLLEEADTRAVNMAKPVADEMQIYIPTINEVNNDTAAQLLENTRDELLNINEATKEELMELPGIGETKAEAIIAYRTEHGMIKDITELMNISGIKEAAFSKIKDKIRV